MLHTIVQSNLVSFRFHYGCCLMVNNSIFCFSPSCLENGWCWGKGEEFGCVEHSVNSWTMEGGVWCDHTSHGTYCLYIVAFSEVDFSAHSMSCFFHLCVYWWPFENVFLNLNFFLNLFIHLRHYIFFKITETHHSCSHGQTLWTPYRLISHFSIHDLQITQLSCSGM